MCYNSICNTLKKRNRADSDMIFLKNEKGVTLIELIVSLMLAAIISVSAVSFMLHAVRVSNRIYTRHELLEHARIAMDSLTIHVLEAESIIHGRLNNPGRLDVFIWRYPPIGNRYLHRYEFLYQPSIRRLNFSGNELASHIEVFSLQFSDGFLEIYIRTENNIGRGIYVEPVSLRRVIDLRFQGD